MTAVLTDSPSDDRLEKVAYLSLLGFAAALQVSIAAANILLGLTALLWLALIISRREAVEVPRFFWWLLAYAAWTLVAAVFSIDPSTSIRDSKQLLLFAVVPIAYRLLRGHRSLVAIDVVISVAALSAAIGIVQFGILKWNTPDQRPQGALGMYMTYSGQLMLVACVAVARILFWPKERVWPLLVLPALIFALTVTLSRNAWVGAGAGIGLLLLFRDFRLLGILPVLLALFIALAPQHITERLTATFQVQQGHGGSDTTTATVQSNQDRIAMAKSGIRMIKDRPITGVGPDMVMELYPVYRDKTAVKQLAVHLHNVPLQIAAERGIPALLLWLGFVFVLARGYFQRHATPSWIFLSNAGLACVAAMIAAGMFEYNFGDSEFLMLFLLLVTLPYAAIRGETGAA
jgi:putative inorganic carbon (HCO3(-)) transporter